MLNENIFHVIKDPVHGTMQFTTAEDNWIKPFIDSDSFQRLRHIKQLGMGDFIFPGAVHTRFNHCLGCCYVASQIGHKIGLAEEERQLVMIACLLHDIGHGPFSHAFEDIFHNKLIRHEAWTPFFLAEFRSDNFFTQYNKKNPRYHLSEEKFSIIENMIMHQSPANRILADIVSSQLDADRLDYLLRDSHFCGVTYGQFDFRWMLHCMAIVNSPQGERLGMTYKGTGVLEHYLVARRLMTRNIYHLPKKIALEFLLIKLLQNLSENLEGYKPFSVFKKTRLGKFLLAANQFNHDVANVPDPNVHKQRFLAENYLNYKELCDYDVFAMIKMLTELKNNHGATQIALRLHRRIIPKIVRLEEVNLQYAQGLLQELKSAQNIQDWQLAIIKTPHQSYKVEEDPILVASEQGQARPINEISVMINAISDKYENTAFLCVDTSLLESDKVQHVIQKLTADIAVV